MIRKEWLLAPVAVVLIGLVVFATGRLSFIGRIASCNTAPKEERFSCYRASIEKTFGKDAPTFAAYLKANGETLHATLSQTTGAADYAIFGTNCHTFYHAAGDYVATYASGDLKALLDMGPTDCTNGYTMGVYKRVALRDNFATDTLKAFVVDCKEGAMNQCSHEVGHTLHDKASYSILKILDDISKKKYGITYPEQYQYVTLSQPNLDASFNLCQSLFTGDNERAQCYTGIGHNLFLFSEFDPKGYETVFNECKEVEQKNLDNCYGFLLYRIGINDAAPYFIRNQTAEGNAVCNDAANLIGRPDLAHHCYLGLGGGIGLYIDSEFSLNNIKDSELESTKNQLLALARMCESADGNFADTCIAGLLGTKFAAYYAKLGIFDEHIERVRSSIDSPFEVVG